jgi:topoisomerase IV subunit A
MTEAPPVAEPTDVALADAIAERYLTYALSTIVSRSLPDARDGLKPVHRRLLYAMRQLKLDPASGFKKCARVVGDVIGKFHPHGDVAVYDAMVRLAQEFALRYPLVEGHGNFGSIDGDGAAAMRYTEARLTHVAEAMLEGIDEDAVDFRPTYDGEEEEPVVLPAAFPNMLANGASGIAVGMATSIPPHNAGELCRALTLLIDDPEADTATLLATVRGPDFPTGGVVIDPPDTILRAYETGRGAFRVRARWVDEPASGGRRRIVITEIPYQVAKGRLIEAIADLLSARQPPFNAEIADESTSDVRLVITLKDRSLDPAAAMEYLFSRTELESRVNLNMNALVDGRTPRRIGLKEALRIFLDHRFEVLKRRSRYRLGRLVHRLEVLSGLLIAMANLDEVIRIIREADVPKTALMTRFSLSEVQADAILNMRLRQLHKLEEIELKREHADVLKRKAELDALLADDELCWLTIADEIAETGRRFGTDTPLGARRTTIETAATASRPAVPLHAGETGPVTVVCSARGWIRAVRGTVEDRSTLRYKEGDEEGFVIEADLADRLLLAATDGRFYTLPCVRLPAGRGFGEPIRLLVDLEDAVDPLTLSVYRAGGRLLVASSAGRGFLVEEDSVLAGTRKGKAVLTLAPGERLARCLPVAAGDDTVAALGDNRRLLVFALDETPVMARGKGVLLQRYRDGGLADVSVFAAADGLAWRAARGLRLEKDLTPWRGRRGHTGKPVPRGFPAATRFT